MFSKYGICHALSHISQLFSCNRQTIGERQCNLVLRKIYFLLCWIQESYEIVEKAAEEITELYCSRMEDLSPVGSQK
jgi:hypothetical protein